MQVTYRRAALNDALCLSALSTQVFLDTYATDGINVDIAKEARNVHSYEALKERLASPTVEVTVAEADGYMVGFLDLSFDKPCPVKSVAGAEVHRLYVQAPFHGRGIGRTLLNGAQATARQHSCHSIWLTAWCGNSRALTFYPRLGFLDVGQTHYVIEGKAYENRVFAKRLAAGAA